MLWAFLVSRKSVANSSLLLILLFKKTCRKLISLKTCLQCFSVAYDQRFFIRFNSFHAHSKKLLRTLSSPILYPIGFTGSTFSIHVIIIFEQTKYNLASNRIERSGHIYVFILMQFSLIPPSLSPVGGVEERIFSAPAAMMGFDIF